MRFCQNFMKFNFQLRRRGSIFTLKIAFDKKYSSQRILWGSFFFPAYSSRCVEHFRYSCWYIKIHRKSFRAIWSRELHLNIRNFWACFEHLKLVIKNYVCSLRIVKNISFSASYEICRTFDFCNEDLRNRFKIKNNFYNPPWPHDPAKS